ncbi:MFS general substrate transporter [Cucurbitaria berberidis CBS 394.84]|uniref:MFS general substrate transporter n=1 Tax=Cucurbitaria berberidis CBS 394.84 TaxID=1168544 RepID=A0A9P4L4B4_9PLEO|nr:MFS general substrate transporter [Cucurbitaria berberidis CBS 394.84]KAF1841295.1 MFS general substrate transporter [Cucurbitaria berberidis CBS 394.84]
MELGKSSDPTLPPGAEKQPVSGITTPDQLAEQQQNYEKSFEDHESATHDTALAEEYPTGKRLLPVLLALVFAVFLVALDITIIGTAIPKITDEFDGLDMVSWYGSVYFMTYGGFQPASGKFYKYFPMKASFVGFTGVFMVGSLISAVSKNSTTFVVGRAIAGVGAAGVATGAFTLVAFAAEPKARPGLIGLIGAVYSLFYINLPICALSIALVLLFFKTPSQAITAKATRKEKFFQMDPLGIALVMAGIISFILAVEYGGQKKNWDSSTVIGLFVGSFLIWVAFGAWEYYNNDRAMLQRSLLFRRSVWMPSAFQFFYSASYVVLLYYLPIYFQSIDNRSAISSGILNLPLVLAMALGSAISGAVVSKTGHAAPFMAAGAVMATISAGLMYTFDIGTPMGKWIGYQLFYGAAVGLGYQMGITIAQANASKEEISSVTATVFFFQTIGGAFSISAAQSGFVNRMVNELAKTAPHINPQMVIGTGATQIRHAFPADQVPAIILAYMAGIKVTFALVVALVGVTCLLVAFVPREQLHAEAREGAGGAA